MAKSKQGRQARQLAYVAHVALQETGIMTEDAARGFAVHRDKAGLLRPGLMYPGGESGGKQRDDRANGLSGRRKKPIG